jgi:hypothetical protein
MEEHSLFYYPYASFSDDQKLLLKAAALFFDKLYILDPCKASYKGIGPGIKVGHVNLLEKEGILERISPEHVLNNYENAITNSIRSDLNDPEFIRLCKTSGRAKYWTLALAKVPKDIREDPKLKLLDRSMQRLMGEIPKEVIPDVSRYAEDYATVYDEYREVGTGLIEYRYADYPLELGESIMINHALFGSLLHTGAIPLTDDKFHNDVLALKIKRAQQIPEIKDIIEDFTQKRRMKSAQLAMSAITDIDLAVLSPELPMEEILKYRMDHKNELANAREELALLARKIRQDPWEKSFMEELEHNTIPEIQKTLMDVRKTRDSWLRSEKRKNTLKAIGLSAGTASAVIGLVLSATPLLPVAIVTGLLGLVSGTVIPGTELALDWKNGKRSSQENGLNYFLKIRELY